MSRVTLAKQGYSETDRKSQFLDDSRVLAGSESGVHLALGARAHHLAAAEDECRRARLSYPHNHGSKALRVVLCVTSVQRYLLQV